MIESSREALRLAVSICKSQHNLAKRIGKKQGHIWAWLNKSKIPSEMCAAVEKATDGKVTKKELRPDVFTD